ncbi:GNAT N-acetyltransferase [Nocardioides anomalus]|uniref:GNAT N-acetyltransferase n=1 Tax=Nocardioides anomalus TaxID=2712223 RepID=A0A6G6WG10_9ACTN|nr:GNAT N-acetyltransferase [Nocardioides anomalus]
MPAPTTAPTLTDGVVTLRAHRADDVPRIVEQCRDPESVAWTTVPTPYDEEDARTYALEIVPQGWAEGRCEFAVEVDRRFAGSVALRHEAPGVAEIAYGSHPDVRGTGAMERALRLVLAWGFEEQGLRTVVWRAFVGNWASRRLAWRLGFRLEGTLRGLLPQRGALHDAWVGTLQHTDPQAPATVWLDNPALEGDGVRLRPFRADDAERVAEGIGDADAQHWLAFLPRDPGPVQGAAYVVQVTDRLAGGHTITWAVADPADDRLLGAVGLYRLAEEPELGYWTHPDARGRGLTTRAGALAVDHAFGTLGLPRLAAYVSAPNTASRAVLERLGFRETGTRREAARTGAGEVVDLVGYDLLAAEWPERSERSTRNASASTTNPATDSTEPMSSGEA